MTFSTTILSRYVGQRPRKRLPGRPDLRLHWEPRYWTLPVQTQKGPLIKNYLETLLRTMKRACHSCSRLLAVRIDLRYPADMPVSEDHAHNGVISRCFWNLRWALDDAKTKYPHALRFVWCREQDKSDKPHYHVLLLLNGDAYRGIGNLRPSAYGGFDEANLFHRIVRAWCQAIGVAHVDGQGLVHVAEDTMTGRYCVKHFHRDDHAAFAEVFYVASYLCKVYSKPLMQRIHCFDSSSKR